MCVQEAKRAGAAGGFSSFLSPSGWAPLPADVAWFALAGMFLLLATYVRHSVYVAGEMYSSPSIVLQVRRCSVILLSNFLYCACVFIACIWQGVLLAISLQGRCPVCFPALLPQPTGRRQGPGARGARHGPVAV